MEDLMEAITHRRAALKLALDHPERLGTLVSLADCLDQQFRREGDAHLLTSPTCCFGTYSCGAPRALGISRQPREFRSNGTTPWLT